MRNGWYWARYVGRIIRAASRFSLVSWKCSTTGVGRCVFSGRVRSTTYGWASERSGERERDSTILHLAHCTESRVSLAIDSGVGVVRCWNSDCFEQTCMTISVVE